MNSETAIASTLSSLFKLHGYSSNLTFILTNFSSTGKLFAAIFGLLETAPFTAYHHGTKSCSSKKGVGTHVFRCWRSMTTKKDALALRAAEWVSLAGSPFLLAALLLLIVSWHATHRVWPALGWAALAAAFVTVGPLVLLALAVSAGRVGNLDLDRRHERPWPMVIALAITVLGLTVLWMLGAPH